MVSSHNIQALIEQALPGSKAEVQDMTGTNDHFQLLVISPTFEGKGMIERHRMVYGVLGSAVGAEIHALKLKTLTPLEAARK